MTWTKRRRDASHRATWIAASLSALVCIGCDPGNTARTEGHVTSNDVQVAGGTVMFLPIGGGQPALGPIRDDGSYTLTTFRTGDGALVGKHRVTVLAKAGATKGEPDARQVCRPPAEFSVSVEPEQTNTIELIIDPKAGWQIYSDS